MVLISIASTISLRSHAGYRTHHLSSTPKATYGLANLGARYLENTFDYPASKSRWDLSQPPRFFPEHLSHPHRHELFCQSFLHHPKINPDSDPSVKLLKRSASFFPVRPELTLIHFLWLLHGAQTS